MPDFPSRLNPLMHVGEFADTKQDADAIDRAIALEHSIQHGDRSTQFNNVLKAAAAGGIDFVSANQLLPRIARGAPLIADDETARLRQNYPAAYYGGQGLTLTALGMANPPLAAVFSGAAIANTPAVQRSTRDLTGWFTRNRE